MYHPPNGTLVASTGAALTSTQVIGLVVLGFALIAAGLCILKLAPRKDRS